MSEDKIYDDSARIPLPFGLAIGSRPSSRLLPLAFRRPLRHIEDGGEIVPDTPPKPNPYRPPDGYAIVSGAWGFVQQAVSTQVACASGRYDLGGMAAQVSGITAEAVGEAVCFQTAFSDMPELESCLRETVGLSDGVAGCMQAVQAGMDGLDGCLHDAFPDDLFLSGCNADRSSASLGEALATCSESVFSDDAPVDDCLVSEVREAAVLARCAHPQSLPALAVPCEYYEIPVEPEPVPETYVCGIRPPSNRLNLRFYRKKIAHDARHIPLPFACFDTVSTPVLNGYIMQNIIKATVDGQPIGLFSASFTTDTAGYCWQGSLTVSPDDFAKINPDVRPKGREAEIEVQINADTFVIIAEDYSDNRRFG